MKPRNSRRAARLTYRSDLGRSNVRASSENLAVDANHVIGGSPDGMPDGTGRDRGRMERRTDQDVGIEDKRQSVGLFQQLRELFLGQPIGGCLCSELVHCCQQTVDLPLPE